MFYDTNKSKPALEEEAVNSPRIVLSVAWKHWLRAGNKTTSFEAPNSFKLQAHMCPQTTAASPLLRTIHVPYELKTQSLILKILFNQDTF